MVKHNICVIPYEQRRITCINDIHLIIGAIESLTVKKTKGYIYAKENEQDQIDGKFILLYLRLQQYRLQNSCQLIPEQKIKDENKRDGQDHEDKPHEQRITVPKVIHVLKNIPGAVTYAYGT
jgi:hypothetical protein